MNLLDTAEITRMRVVARTKDEQRRPLSQYLTPIETAKLAVSLFSRPKNKELIHCLDLGAGTGILTVALFETLKRNSAFYTCFELSEDLASICQDEMDKFNIPSDIVIKDVLKTNFINKYNRIILNPPYKKMAATDYRKYNLPTNCPNLYIAFIMKAIQALRKGGEMVAIIPRSWTNGVYFIPFRKWLFSQVSIDAIHTYGSRSEIFSDTNVLQETMILKVSKRKQQKWITISESLFKNSKITSNKYEFSNLISNDSDFVLCLSSSSNNEKLAPLCKNGFCASTGKIVDFRSHEFLSNKKLKDSVPLIYPCNLRMGTLKHPTNTDKYQWFNPTKYTEQQLLSPGAYVAVNRFSPKEEKRRIKATFINTSYPLALENHINYIHCGTSRINKPIIEEIAKGLCMWLNSSYPEQWFRARSGNTQVNASDLNAMPIPNTKILREVSHLWLNKLPYIDYLDSCFKRFI